MAEPIKRNYRRNPRYIPQGYMDGNAVRRMQAVPAPAPQHKTPKQVSHRAQVNRDRALSMNPAFVLFLTLVSIAILFACVNFLQMKSEITRKANTLAVLESEYSQLKADNDAYYSQVSSSADIEKIKAIAINRLGMKYASEDQVITYTTERSSYVKQYQDVPGVE